MILLKPSHLKKIFNLKYFENEQQSNKEGSYCTILLIGRPRDPKFDDTRPHLA